MRLLLLHPTPGLGRQRSYSETCRLLEARGHSVVLAYNGPVEDGLRRDVTTYHFDTWVRENRARIDATRIEDLERSYERSNLFLGIVSERRIADFSFVGSSYPHVDYDLDELHRLVVAVVLFYEEILASHDIEAVLAHHPDNIHSTLLFEMSRSRSPVCFLTFPDFYWQQEANLLFDSKYFTSKNLLRSYERNLAAYDDLVAPREAEIEGYLEVRLRRDPSRGRSPHFPPTGLRRSLRNIWEVLRRGRSRIYLRRPPIVEGYGQIYLWASLRAFLRRQVQLKRIAFSRRFAQQLPDGPFVYFPLQRVPEAAMLVRATSYLNQQGLVQALAASLPAGFRLVVKDHPRSVGLHPLSFYDAFGRLPNVEVLVPDFPNEEILARTTLVATIAGTLGFQQLMNGGGPVLMFGRKFYECLEGVIRVDDMNRLPYLLKEVLLFGEHVPEARVRQRSLYSFIAAMIDSRYLTRCDAETLHFDPEVLAELIDSMIEKELKVLCRRERDSGASGSGPTGDS